MFKKVLILLIVSIAYSHFCAAQYTDDAKDKSDTSLKANEKPPLIDIKQNGIVGLEFMITASNGTFFCELSPFAGVKIKDKLIVGAGLHGSVLAIDKPYPYYGAHIFARVNVTPQYFFHAEYRLLNGIIPGSINTLDRKWVSSPIAGIGAMYGNNTWFLIGYAFNKDFQQINPFRSLVYRIGFYF